MTSRLGAFLRRALGRFLRETIEDVVYRSHHIYGDASRVRIHQTANVNNALFNTASGTITVGECSFMGHNVLLLTGTHDYHKRGIERQRSIPETGRDIRIGRGVWIGTNVTVLGPCDIGDNAVIAAHSLVNKDVRPNSIVGGVPAHELRTIANEDAR